jgi:hypothetical protein
MSIDSWEFFPDSSVPGNCMIHALPGILGRSAVFGSRLLGGVVLKPDGMAGDFVDQQTQTIEYICLDIDALARKIVERLPDSQATVFAAGSLAMAVYVLRLSMGGQVPQGNQPQSMQGYQPQLQQPQQAQYYQPAVPVGPPVPSVAHNPGGLDIASIAQQIAERMALLEGPRQVPDQLQPQSQPQRNLANEWAGPLPTLHAVPTPSATRNGVVIGPEGSPSASGSGRSAVKELLRIKVVDPSYVCRDCGGSVYDHAKERHAPHDSKGRAVYMLCGNRRVRCEPE